MIFGSYCCTVSHNNNCYLLFFFTELRKLLFRWRFLTPVEAADSLTKQRLVIFIYASTFGRFLTWNKMADAIKLFHRAVSYTNNCSSSILLLNKENSFRGRSSMLRLSPQIRRRKSGKIPSGAIYDLRQRRLHTWHLSLALRGKGGSCDYSETSLSRQPARW